MRTPLGIAVRLARVAGLAAALAASLVGATQSASAAMPSAARTQPSGRWRDASLEDYRKHLQELTLVVGACAKARDLRSCDPMLVGPDDRVPLADSGKGGRRLVRYGWLRILLSKAEEPDQPKPGPSDEPDTGQLLTAAASRLAEDAAHANAAAMSLPAHVAEHEVMRQVLAGRDFSDLEQPSASDTLKEKLGAWLNKIFQNASLLRAGSAWVGRLVVWGFILAVCLGLAWALLQLERRWRIRLTPEQEGTAAGAASARDWQRWLEDARQAASGGRWREAIHFAYWAAISRLESRRLWPADRARTPREYLALVAHDDPRRAGLKALTVSFERTWYGGREAVAEDYRQAEELAAGLIAGDRGAAGPEGARCV